MTRTLLALSLLGAVALSGCGRMGDLESPAGAMPPRTDASATGQARSDNGDPAQNPEAAVNRQSSRNRDIDPAPARTLPIEGMGSDPFAVAPQGALPDPYANPQ